MGLGTRPPTRSDGTNRSSQPSQPSPSKLRRPSPRTRVPPAPSPIHSQNIMGHGPAAVCASSGALTQTAGCAVRTGNRQQGAGHGSSVGRFQQDVVGRRSHGSIPASCRSSGSRSPLQTAWLAKQIGSPIEALGYPANLVASAERPGGEEACMRVSRGEARLYERVGKRRIYERVGSAEEATGYDGRGDWVRVQ